MRRVDKLVLRIAHKMLKIYERRDTYWHGNIFTFFTRYNANDDCQIIKYNQIRTIRTIKYFLFIFIFL